jgi:hypothetical protein
MMMGGVKVIVGEGDVGIPLILNIYDPCLLVSISVFLPNIIRVIYIMHSFVLFNVHTLLIIKLSPFVE